MLQWVTFSKAELGNPNCKTSPLCTDKRKVTVAIAQLITFVFCETSAYETVFQCGGNNIRCGMRVIQTHRCA